MSTSEEMVVEKAAGRANDSTLLRRLRWGDYDAATQLYIRYAERLRLLAQAECNPMLARHVGVEDIVQSVFGSFFRRAAQGAYDVPDGNELWNLLLVITLNKIRAKALFYQAGKRDVRRQASVEIDGWFQSKHKSDRALYSFLKLVIDEALDEMPSQAKEIVCMRIDGYHVDEIAEKTQRSKRSVERNLHDFRKKLAGVLEQEKQ